MNRRVISEVSRVKELMGVINENIESVLEGGKILRKGNRGPDVEKLQKLLIEMGYDLGDFGPNKDGVDGAFGGTVDKIVREFQNDNGLKVDGKVGKDTLSKMITVGQSKIPNFFDFLGDIGLNIDTIGGLGAAVGIGLEKLMGGTDESKNHFVLYFAFPGYQPRFDEGNEDGWIESAFKWIRSKAEEFDFDVESTFIGEQGTYGKMGHAGVALVNSQGKINIFEFGRYDREKSSKGIGVVKKSSLSGAKIKDGKITNLDSVCSAIKNKSAGAAKQYDMDLVSIPITKEGYSKGISYAKSSTDKPYEILDFDSGDKDANCATFGLEVVRLSSGQGQSYCLPNPGAGIRIAKMYSGTQTSSC